MAHNFQRPSLPYENESLQNDKRYQLLTRSNKRPPTDQMLDTDVNYLIDAVRQLDEDIAGVSAGIIPGADNPDNANFFPTTDGDGNISWTDVTDQNVRERSLSGSRLLPQTITADEIMDGTIPASKLAPDSVPTIKIVDFNVTANKLAPNSVPTDKIVDLNVTTEKIADENVTAEKLAPNSVPTEKIVDGAVTLPKVNAVFPVTMGGSGLSTLTTSNGVICAGTTPTGNFQNAGVGSLNQIFMGNGGSAVGSWKNLNTLAAVKADQVAANSTEVYTNPSVQQHHPSACKAWVLFDGDQLSNSAVPILASYNVASVVQVSGAQYIITFIVPFSSANYAVIGTSSYTSGTPESTYVCVSGSASYLTTSVKIETRTAGGALARSNRVSVTCFGAQ